MKKLLRRLLFVNDATTAAVDELPAVSPRGALHASIAIRLKHELALAEAKAATQRVYAVVQAADLAQDEADQARAAAAAATRRWAEKGALADVPIGDADLNAVAVDAARKAAEARFAAEGAETGLASIQGAEQDARLALDAAQSGVQDAIREILLSEIEADFELIASAYASAVEAERRVHGLAHALRHGRFHNTPTGGGDTLLKRLDALKPRIPDDAELREKSRPWIEFARALSDDPNTSFLD